MGSFGENFRRLMRHANTNQTEVASRMRSNKPTVSAWAKKGGTRLPDTPQLLRLAAAIPCTVDELLEGIDLAYEEAKRRLSQQDARRSPSTGELIPLLEEEQLVVDGYRAMPEFVRRVALIEAQAYIDEARAARGREHDDDATA